MRLCVAAVLKEACKQGAAILQDPAGQAVSATACAIKALEVNPT